MTKLIKTLRIKAISFLLLYLVVMPSMAQIKWPSGQLLPSFPAPAQGQDLIILRQSSTYSSAEMYLFASLKGIVNRTKPRIFSYEGDAFAEGPHTWLQSLGLSWSEPADKWDLITKYRTEISGLIASPLLLSRLTAPPYNLPVLLDLRGKFRTKLEVYQSLYDTYWPHLDHRLLIGLNPDAHKAALREYAVALGTAVIWLDPKVAGESELLDKFLSSMSPGSSFMGWWPQEGPGVERASKYGIATIASDWCSNLTVHSGTSRVVHIKPMPLKPVLKNKIYVAFILSDGDNLQYTEHLMRKLWNNQTGVRFQSVGLYLLLCWTLCLLHLTTIGKPQRAMTI
jgi:hypothetical protein